MLFQIIEQIEGEFCITRNGSSSEWVRTGFQCDI